MLKILCCAEIKGIKERLWFMNLAVFSGSVGLEYRREQENKLGEHQAGAWRVPTGLASRAAPPRCM